MHKLAWDAFVAGTEVAKAEGLYGAGQDLLKDAFSGNVRGMGPAVAEMEIEERPNEPFLLFAADKTDSGRRARAGLDEGVGDAAAGVLRRCHGAHGGARVHGHHGDAGAAREAVHRPARAEAGCVIR